MRILGIDPGLSNTGWGVVEASGSRFSCISFGCLTSDPSMPLAQRLASIHDGLRDVIGAHLPDECAIESVYFSNNARTAFATGQARGAALVAAAAGGVDVGEYGPGEVKMAVVGNGSADKRQVAYMVRIILSLAEGPRPDHAADALAVAICHANLRGAAREAAVGTPADGVPGGTGDRDRTGGGWAAAVMRAERKAERGRR